MVGMQKYCFMETERDFNYLVVGDNDDELAVTVLRYPANGRYIMERASHHPKSGRNEAGDRPDRVDRVYPSVITTEMPDKDLSNHKLYHDTPRTHATPTSGAQLTQPPIQVPSRQEAHPPLGLDVGARLDRSPRHPFRFSHLRLP